MNNRFHAPRLLCALVLSGLAGAASANLTHPVYATAKDEVKAMFKTERDNCGSLSGNAKDVCVERAKGQEKVALAHLEYQYTGKEKDRNDYLEARYEAKYKVAKEACDDKSGNAKDVCVADAKVWHDKAKADLKANKKIADAQNDQMEAKLKADYKAANERCDSLSGDAKDSCQASAKARYFQ
jgi:bisphosphoglycerate-dependent phosphoglycerate mutase